ncbi:hypothetical protein C4564_02585 [Candidatus Microgenomates bacterium]|nr:MAG: hypothetical protein C4564_02585 [Candidatus Microgenomates bacterium]
MKMSDIKDKIVPGCGHFDSSNGVCRLMFKGGDLPPLAVEAMIDPPGAIEGPPVEIKGWLCSTRSTDLQESCTSQTPRSPEQDEADYNW